MKGLFRNMDSLKAMILVCVVASLGLGIWLWMLHQDFDRVQGSWRRAQRDVVEIHSLLKQIQPLYQAKDEQGAGQGIDPGVYFETQLINYGRFKKQHFVMKAIDERSVLSGKNKAVDRVQRIDFKPRNKQRLYFPRSNIFRALYNCEKNSKRWKLRELHLVAKEAKERKGRKDQGYPDELSDEWAIDKFVFASREPRAK